MPSVEASKVIAVLPKTTGESAVSDRRSGDLRVSPERERSVAASNEIRSRDNVERLQVAATGVTALMDKYGDLKDSKGKCDSFARQYTSLVSSYLKAPSEARLREIELLAESFNESLTVSPGARTHGRPNPFDTPEERKAATAAVTSRGGGELSADQRRYLRILAESPRTSTKGELENAIKQVSHAVEQYAHNLSPVERQHVARDASTQRARIIDDQRATTDGHLVDMLTGLTKKLDSR